MSAHDPLCSWHGTATKPPGCDCALIALVRVRTRATIAAEIEAATPEEIEDADYLSQYIRGMEDAARVAKGVTSCTHTVPCGRGGCQQRKVSTS